MVTGIVKLATVVRCRKDSDQLTFVEELIAVFHHLMGSANEIYIVFFKKKVHYFGTESIGDASFVFHPALDQEFT